MSVAGVRNLAGLNKKMREAIDAGTPYKDPLFKPDELTPTRKSPNSSRCRISSSLLTNLPT